MYRELRVASQALEDFRMGLASMMRGIMEGASPLPHFLVMHCGARCLGFVSDAERFDRVRDFACEWRVKRHGAELVWIGGCCGPVAIDVLLSVVHDILETWVTTLQPWLGRDLEGTAMRLVKFVTRFPTGLDLDAAIDLERRAIQAEIRSNETPRDPATVHIVADQIHVDGRRAVKASSRPSPFDMSCGEVATTKQLAAWVVAKERAEQIVKRHGFPGFNALARLCLCGKSTMRTAIDRSESLLEAEASYLVRHAPDTIDAAPPRRQDMVPQAERDDALRRLVEICTPEQRQALHDPGRKADIDAMSLSEIEALISNHRQRGEHENA